MFFCGIDIGSRTGKVAVINKDRTLVFSSVIETVESAKRTYFNLIEKVPENLRKEQFYQAVTGYGRDSALEFAGLSATEITCHFMGVRFFYPEVSSIIDIGGQDSKVITVDENGKIKDFIMNDRCAAGTGRFIEVMCNRIGFSVLEFASLDVSCVETEKINSTCTVFAESEVISMISKDIPQKVIASSLARMVAVNTFSMARKIHPTAPFFMSGGVSKIKPVKYHLEKLFASEIKTDENSQLMGAIGAALFAMKTRG